MILKRKNKFSFLLFFLIFKSCFIVAQDPIYYNLNDENGLPSNEVYQVIQDKFGYIWIGCDAGLFRYDGFEYKQYKNADQNGRSISDLQLDSKDRIWCRNFNGQIYCVDKDTLQIASKRLKTDISHVFYSLDNIGNAWVILNGSIKKISSDGKILYQQKLSLGSIRFTEINAISVNKEKVYFADRSNNVYVLDIITKKIIKISKTGSSPENNSFFQKENDLYLLSTETISNTNRIYKIINNKLLFIQKIATTQKNSRIYTFCSDNINKLWLCTSNGFGLYKPELKSLDNLNCFLKGKNISYLFHDLEGNYWITTLQNGIYIIPNLDVLRFDNNNSGLLENNLTVIKNSYYNQLIIGTHSGRLFNFNCFNNQFSEIKPLKNAKTISVKFLYKAGHSIFASHGFLSEIYKNKIKKSHPIGNSRKIEIVGDTLFFIMNDFNGKISLKELNSKQNFILQETGGHDLVYSEQNQTLYYALNNGLFSLKNGKWFEIKFNNHAIIAASLGIHKGFLCVASINDGLILIKGNKITHNFNSKNSFIENELKLVASSDNYIWCSGNKKLTRLNLNNSKTAHYTIHNGVNPNDINSIDFIKGKIYLATNKGLVLFPENMNWENTVPPALKISSVLLAGKRISDFRNIILPFDKRSISFQISSATYKSRGNYSFQYRLIGLDTNWITVSAINKTINYSALPSGEYTFEIKAINENNIASKVQFINVLVESPLWQKWWFYLISSLLIISISVFVFYQRIKYIKRKALIKNKLITSQLTALKSQMNPHFMFNALNSIQDLVLRNDVKNSNLYIGKFSKLMRMILEASDQNMISLIDEITILHLYLDLEKLRFKEDFEYEITLDKAIDTYSIYLPSMILQPFVENALKHGLLHKKGLKTLKINFSQNEKIICTIKDNGIGRIHADEIKMRQSKGNQSFATQATEKRIELLNNFTDINYTFEIIDLYENELALGTTVIISLPLQ